MTVVLVPPDRVGAVWPHVAARMAKAAAVLGHYDEADIRAAAERGDWTLWAEVEGGRVTAAALTEVDDKPRMRVLWVVYAVGENAEAVNRLWPAVRVHARMLGCRQVIGLLRRGFFRAGKPHADWRPMGDVGVAEVPDG